MLAYLGVIISLFGWTVSSNLITTKEMKTYYLLSLVMSVILGIIIVLIWRKKRNLYVCMITVFLLVNIGASLAYRMNSTNSSGGDKISHSKLYFADMVLMCVVFVLTYVIIRYTRLYRMKFVNVLIISGLPLIFVIARLSGEKINGSYLSFFGILIFGIILTGYPFVSAYFLSKPEERYLRGSVRSMPMNLLVFLGYTFVLYAGCVVCNEFGLLLVLGITSTLLFYLRSKNMRTKLLYTAMCGTGAIIACFFVSHIHDRVYIWMHLTEIRQGDALEGRAESILYLYRNLDRTGFWGNGIGSVPVSIYPTLNTDHSLVALILEYSMILAVGVLICGLIYIKAMMEDVSAVDLYDYALNLSSALIVGAVMLIHIGSNLGSSITAGVGYPFVSEGSTTNVMFAVLTAIHCALYERGRVYALSEKEILHES